MGQWHFLWACRPQESGADAVVPHSRLRRVSGWPSAMLPSEQNRAHQSLPALAPASRPGRLGKLSPEACSLAPSLEVHQLTSH